MTWSKYTDCVETTIPRSFTEGCGDPSTYLRRQAFFWSWWRHQMESFSVTGPLRGESTDHRWVPLTKASDAEGWCFFSDQRLNKQLRKQSRRRWFEMPSRSLWRRCKESAHYYDVIMDTIASQITSLTIIYSTVYSDADQSKHQSSASLAFVREIHRGLVNFPHKWPVTRKMFPFDDVIMKHRVDTTIWICSTHQGTWKRFLHYWILWWESTGHSRILTNGQSWWRTFMFPGLSFFFKIMKSYISQVFHYILLCRISNVSCHDFVIKWNHFRVTGHLCGEFTTPGVFPAQRPVTRSFDVFFDLGLNKRLSKQSWGWWF